MKGSAVELKVIDWTCIQSITMRWPCGLVIL